MHTLKRFTENIGWLFIGTIVSNFITIFISIFLIRKLAIADFGIYSLFMGSLAIFSIFSVNGIIVAVRRFIPELIQKKYFLYHKQLIKKLYLLSLVLCFIVVFIVFLYRNDIGRLLNINKFETYYSIFIINIFLFLQTNLTSNFLVTLYEQKFLSIIGVLSVVLRGLLYAVFLRELTIDLIFVIEAVCVGVKAVPSLIFAYRKIHSLAVDSGEEIGKQEKKEYVKRIKRFAWLSTANEMGEGGFSEISDYYFVSAYLGPYAMGLYAFPYKILSSIFNWIPMAQLNNIFKPYFITSYYERDEDSSYLSQMFNFVLKIYFLFYGLIIAGIIAYKNLILTYVFDSKYNETQILLFIVIGFYVLKAFGFPITIILEIKEKIEYTLYAKIFAVFNVFAVILVLAFTNWGLIGVAAATGLSSLLKNYYLYFYMRRITEVRLHVSSFLRAFILFIILTASMFLGSLINNILLQILLPLMLGMISFQLFYRVTKPFSRNEEIILSKLFEKLPVKFNFISKILALNN